ncbi:MAG TPA: ribosome maturation factor RimM [Candidatus Limnocylindrales bacterium]
MLLTVGQIVRPHGVRGEVIVAVRTDEPDLRFREGAVFVAGSSRLTVASARPHLGRLIVIFDEVPDREAAEAVRGQVLEVDSESIEAPADPEEFHDHQLVGLEVVDMQGVSLGSIQRVEHAPASDLLVVALADGRTGYIPFVKAIVPTVDLPNKKVIVDPPGGLLDL